ncbi:MAG: hypothetical protein A2751_03350 [Candidatus Doudnabacteria bacterium RIFCSPHIGHO2_01_FULL_46_14]|uniref:SpaA-like prealbumin fold domain-containing protein n=1 Tax=Candidatus Doudnabacteria bacterium RIFCSPHIGHO2_01_FULL_46_14 TaxID=1817824 RepID=A0A1F5NLA1_9BACT|nr:MAG: hypothetical protein A2751_03350 [Candidatus Doudnabacteria bacterium RIFCSPHIGHO2_01_FULL_46_14]
MKKFVAFFSIIFSIIPVATQALIMLPTVTVSVVKNSIGADGIFHFDIIDTTISADPYDSFDIVTQDGTGAYNSSVPAFGSVTFDIRESAPFEWETKQISCIGNGLLNSDYSLGKNIVRVTADPFAIVTCYFTNVQASPSAVLIVPGILGTDIKKSEEVLWADIPRMINPANSDSFMDPLQFQSDLSAIDNNVYGDAIITKKTTNIGNKEVVLFDYTASLINEFQTQGYQENIDLFTFPYDWRYGVTGVNGQNLTNVDLLKLKIQEILNQTGASAVDIIAHSTGGLIVKKYVIDNPDHNLNKVVFVGVPNLGSPKAVKVLAQGDNFGVVGLSDEEMKKIARNLPVTYDLAPSQKYFDRNGSFLRIVDRDASGVRTSDLDYQKAWDLLASQDDSNAAGLANGEALHSSSFEDFDLRTAGVDFYNVVGCKTGSIGKVVQYRDFDPSGNAQISFAPVKEIKGDKTVPFESADSNKADDSKKYYVIKANHGEMLSANGTRQLLVNLITGSDLNTGTGIITKQQLDSDPKQCELKGKWWQFFSPVDIEVLDENGKRAGIAEDGSIQNDILGSDYAVFDDHKFVYLPDDGVYQINLRGTGNGTFTLKGQTIENGQTIASENFIDIPVTISSSGTINTDGLQTMLNFDNQNILPTTILDENASQDLIAPVSTAQLTGHKGTDNFFRSSVEVVLAASDDRAGVLKTVYRLDGGEWTNFSHGFLVETEGKHTLDFYSIDRAGNKEPVQSVEFVVDRTAPEASTQFDPHNRDIHFTGTDNLSEPDKIIVTDADDKITLHDQAGNETILRLKGKDRKRKQKIELTQLLYNGRPADLQKAMFNVSWQFDKKTGQLKLLQQRVRSKKDFYIESLYKNNRTRITGRDHSGKIRLDLPGLILLKIQTKSGDIEWGY